MRFFVDLIANSSRSTGVTGIVITYPHFKVVQYKQPLLECMYVHRAVDYKNNFIVIRL